MERKAQVKRNRETNYSPSRLALPRVIRVEDGVVFAGVVFGGVKVVAVVVTTGGEVATGEGRRFEVARLPATGVARLTAATGSITLKKVIFFLPRISQP